MKKKFFSVLLALVLVLSFSLVTATPVAAATINVPGDYDTIQDAIDAAQPNDTIIVAAGTYREYLHITTDDLTIEGAGIDQSIIDLDGLIPYWHYETNKSFASRAGVLITGYLSTDEIIEGVTFKGFTVKNAGLNPPITDTGTHDGGDNAVILTDSTASWTDDELVGEWVHNVSDKLVKIDIEGNTPIRSYGEITANTATTVTATLAGGLDNDWDAGDTYVVMPYEQYVDVAEDGQDDVRGISIANGKDVSILYCEVINSGYGGITVGKARLTTLQQSEGVTIDHCVSSDNPQVGISVGDYLGSVTITNNTCSNNKRPHPTDPSREYAGVGIQVSGKKGGSPPLSGLIAGNTCSNNGFEGIVLKKYADGIIIKNNTVTGSNFDQDGAGIFFYGDKSKPENCQNNIIKNNTVTGNIRGICAYYAQGGTIEGNTITTASGTFPLGQAAIKIDGGNTITVKDNIISCDGAGIRVTNTWNDIPSYENTFTGNTITGAKFAGVRITKGAHDNTFEYNTITGTTVLTIGEETQGDGVFIDDDAGQGNEFHFNNIYGNADDGMENQTTTEVGATENWWGDAVTTTDAIESLISGTVDYSPWLVTSPITGTAPNIVESDHPWTWYTNDSIQDAIDAADSGDTIIVAPGTYGGVNINNTLTVLSSDGAGATTILGKVSINLGYDDGSLAETVFFGGEGSGFTVTGGGIDLDIINESSLTIEGNIITECGCGIWSSGPTIGSGSSVVIRGNQIILNDCGIDLDFVVEASSVTIEGNLITENEDGIYMGYVDGSTVDIKGNTITNNWAGICHEPPDGFLFDSSLTIQDNLISGNDFVGIGFLEPEGPPLAVFSSVTIKGNAITNNGSLDDESGGGIAFVGPFYTSSLTIDDNFISGNFGMWPEFEPPPTGGVMVGGFFEGSSLTITGNTIGAGTGPKGSPYSGNAPLGIFVGCVEPGNSADIHFNNIAGNTELGLLYCACAFDGGDVIPVNAALNWWGTTSGEAILAMIDGPEYTVIYEPWLPVPIDKIEDGAWQGVVGSNPEVDLKDRSGNTIAKVDIFDAPSDASGTIIAIRYSTEPEPQGTSLSLGTGETGVVFVDILVTGYDEGTAHITVPYADANNDGWVDDIVPAMDENTLRLYYWDMGMWRLAGNSAVDADANTVSGDIAVAALQGTPIGLGGNTGEAIVAIDSISYLHDEDWDTISLTINTNAAFLGAATIDLTFDPSVIEVLGYEDGDFDVLTVNLAYQVDGNNQTARFVAYQTGAAGVDATDGAVLARVKLRAVGDVLSSCPLTVGVVTLTDNELNDVDYFTIDGTATCSGVGDANLDYVVDSYDCVYTARAIAGFPPTDGVEYIITPAVMDVDGDDEVDAEDCTYLARHIALIPGYEQLGG